jgi:hypothetical protein
LATCLVEEKPFYGLNLGLHQSEITPGRTLHTF